jgi:DNA-binding transcriptional LysR family regulator
MSDLRLDPVLLSTFVTVARCLGFTEAGRVLGLGQPTVSEHVRRLEAAVGRRLFIRDTHRVSLTADGETMLGFARTILETGERARQHFARAGIRGRVRFGASDDFVLTRLPEILRHFTERHRAVDVELTVALSGELYQMLDAGELDLVLAKRRAGEGRGRPVWRERLVWIGLASAAIDPDRPIPLVMYKAPSVTRAMTTEALDRAGLAWRIACTSGSLIGLRAAALAGLGLMVQAQGMVPPGLVALRRDGLPSLGEVEFVLAAAGDRLREPAAALAVAIEKNQDRLQGSSTL